MTGACGPYNLGGSATPILVAPERGEPLLLYIAASNHVVSAALVVEREEPGHQLKV